MDAARIFLVVWSGRIGGAETFTAELAAALRDRGLDTRVLFVTDAGSLGERLRAAGVPFTSLGLSRGRAIIGHTRRYARAAQALGPDGAVLSSPGYMAGALRGGGYPAPIVAVEHGALLEVPNLGPVARSLRLADWHSGIRAVTTLVAVSETMRREIVRHRHSRPLTVIPNGVDLTRFQPQIPAETGDLPLRFGVVSRLRNRKGIDIALEALAGDVGASRLEIYGDGPARPALEGRTAELGLRERVTFHGPTLDPAGVWANCDVALVPSLLPESFGLSAVEAMACGRPVIASMVGELPTVVTNDVTGLTVAPGDPVSLSAAMASYRASPELRTRHGAAGRRRCEERYDIRGAIAASYEELLLRS